MSHTADGCEISTVSRSRYACSKCTARHLFRSRVLKEEKGFQSSYARPLRSARLEDGCSQGFLAWLLCKTTLLLSLAQDANAYGHSAGCTQVCVSQSNDSHLSSLCEDFFQFLLKVKF